MQNVVATVLILLSDRETRRSLLERPKHQSQDLLDVLQELLDFLPLRDVRPQVLLATYELSKRTRLYPKSLRLSRVEALQQSEDHGSFGDIWKGNFSGTLVAIKVMRQPNAKRLLKTFIGKAILWRELSHPNVLSFYGIHLWPNDGRICLVSPWMENGNLVSYLKDHSDADHLALAIDVAQGVEYLHSFDPQIIHGDLKGNNILITSDLRACVADFGLGKFIQTDALCQFTPSTTLPGTLMWCAPELVNDNRPTISLASDVYALGCVFYEIFAGEVRFAHLTEILHLVTAISSGTIPERPEGIDDSIWGIMLHCWELKPMSRPTARRIVEMLQTIRKRHSGRKSPSPRPMLTPIIHENILINTHPAQTVPSSDSETISTSDIEESSTLTLKETAVVEPVVIPAVATERADKITEDLAFEAAIPELAALVELTTEAEAEAIADTTDSSLGEADSEDKTLKIHSIRSPLEQVETEMSLSIDHAMSIPTWLRVAKSHRSFKVLQGLKFDKFKDRLMKDPRNDDIVIPIMGPTGTGRSSFINILMGNDAMKVGHELQSCTAQLDYTILHSSKYPQLGVQGHHRIVILDTPGFDDTFETDYEI
ncbi:kinase-like domain-containing protein, partial [Mycena floridula]